jgi:hypothetical protein
MNKLTRDDLKGLVELKEGEAGTVEQKIDNIMETVKYIIMYSQFKSVTELGVTVNLKDLPFERAMIFSWIKEGIESGRKT